MLACSACLRRRYSRHSNCLSKLAGFSLSERHPCLVLLRPSSEALLRARAPGAKNQHGCRSLSFCFRRWPIHLGVSAAVKTGEAVAAFTARIRQRCKGDGGVVEGAAGLFVKQVNLGHHRDRGIVPRWGRLFFAGNLFFRMASFAFSFVRFDAGEMGREVCHVHRSATSGLETGEMFML